MLMTLLEIIGKVLNDLVDAIVNVWKVLAKKLNTRMVEAFFVVLTIVVTTLTLLIASLFTVFVLWMLIKF